MLEDEYDYADYTYRFNKIVHLLSYYNGLIGAKQTFWDNNINISALADIELMLAISEQGYDWDNDGMSNVSYDFEVLVSTFEEAYLIDDFYYNLNASDQQIFDQMSDGKTFFAMAIEPGNDLVMYIDRFSTLKQLSQFYDGLSNDSRSYFEQAYGADFLAIVTTPGYDYEIALEIIAKFEQLQTYYDSLNGSSLTNFEGIYGSNLFEIIQTSGYDYLRYIDNFIKVMQLQNYYDSFDTLEIEFWENNFDADVQQMVQQLYDWDSNGIVDGAYEYGIFVERFEQAYQLHRLFETLTAQDKQDFSSRYGVDFWDIVGGKGYIYLTYYH